MDCCEFFIYKCIVCLQCKLYVIIVMELTLKVFDGLDVQTSILDSSGSNVCLDSSCFIEAELFNSSGNCILTIINSSFL